MIIAEEVVKAKAGAVGVPPLIGMTPWEVHKFGGASLADAKLYETCSKLLISESERNGSTPTAAVVSAMKGMTDKLISVVEMATSQGEKAAKAELDAAVEAQCDVVRDLLQGHDAVAEEIMASIGKDHQNIEALLRSLALLKVAPNTLMEYVAGMGEIWSAQIMCGYLKTCGVPTAWINARDVLIVEAKDTALGAKGGATDMKMDPIYDITQAKLENWWQTQGTDVHKGTPILVITGFVASTPTGVPTTLKRSGSDFSATIFAQLLRASRVTLWKNVDGVFSADPGVVHDALPVSAMSYDEAIELAYFGGQVLHPSAMAPCMDMNMPLFVRNVFNPSFPGTIINRSGFVETDDSAGVSMNVPLTASLGPVKAVTAISRIAMVDIEGGSWASVSQVAARTMLALNDAGLKVVLVTQASSEHSISVAVDEAQGRHAAKVVQAAFELEIARGQVSGVRHAEGYSMLTIIGDGMRGFVGTSAKLLGALARGGVNVVAVAQGSSERNVTVVVERPALGNALQSVHAEFAGTASAFRESVNDALEDLNAPYRRR